MTATYHRPECPQVSLADDGPCICADFVAHFLRAVVGLTGAGGEGMMLVDSLALMFRMAGRVVTDDDRYLVADVVSDGLTVSLTTLKAGRETRGHMHDHPEIYVVLSGRGLIGEGPRGWEELWPGVVLRIPAGQFHRVKAAAETDLTFLSFFAAPRDD